jgi:predicted Zn-ribbon and HTH transcriptional regulator
MKECSDCGFTMDEDEATVVCPQCRAGWIEETESTE